MTLTETQVPVPRQVAAESAAMALTVPLPPNPAGQYPVAVPEPDPIIDVVLTPFSYEHYNASRSPCWRWQRIMELVSSGRRCSSYDDEWVQKGRRFLGDLRRAKGVVTNQLRGKHTGAALAYDIRHNTNTRARTHMEAWILTGQSDVEIANRIGTLPGTVRWYEALFFHVRDRLQARDWIYRSVLMVDSDAFRDAEGKEVKDQRTAFRQLYDSTLKLFAFIGGTDLLQYTIEGFNAVPQKPRGGSSVRSFSDAFIRESFRRAALSLTGTVGIGGGEQDKEILFRMMSMHLSLQAQEAARASAHASGPQIDLGNHLQAAMSSIPFAIGVRAIKQLAGSPLLEYDALAAELTSDELIAVSGGAAPPAVEEIKSLKLPAPSKERFKADAPVKKAGEE